MNGYDYHVTDSYDERSGEIQAMLHEREQVSVQSGNYDSAGAMESAIRMIDHLEGELDKRDDTIQHLLKLNEELNGKVYALEETINGQH